MDEYKRSCFSCKHRDACLIFNNVRNNTGKVRMNMDGFHDAPGKWSDIFSAIGNCCLEYGKK